MDRLSTGQMADNDYGHGTEEHSPNRNGVKGRRELGRALYLDSPLGTNRVDPRMGWEVLFDRSLVESQVPEKRLMQLNLHRVRDEQRRRHLLQASTRSSSHIR